MAFVNGPRKAPDGSKTHRSWVDVAPVFPGALIVGIGMVFGWRAFRQPRIILLIAASIGLGLTARLVPLKARPVDKPPHE